jgi:hypothetical protein
MPATAAKVILVMTLLVFTPALRKENLPFRHLDYHQSPIFTTSETLSLGDIIEVDRQGLQTEDSFCDSRSPRISG